mmetsp:Transcript_65092/g.174804  ORF Transcript_65092/g.174804 Transcript_65092/m.174804 type:complete len:255 (+) Transcript_65092:185-949(+)
MYAMSVQADCLLTRSPFQVVLQLADASGTSAPPQELKPVDVPAWRTKLCVNRMEKLKKENFRLEEKKQELEAEILRKQEAKSAAAADLNARRGEFDFVKSFIAARQRERKEDEKRTADAIHRKRDELLADHTLVGDTMRRTQSARQAELFAHAKFDSAELTRTNLEASERQAEAVRGVFDRIAAERTASGIELRVQRAKNAATVKTIEEAELKRVQVCVIFWGGFSIVFYICVRTLACMWAWPSFMLFVWVHAR